MDYEKKYKEALSKAKQVYKTPYTAHWDVMKELIEHLFPELKESQDERIRKWLIRDIKQSLGDDVYNDESIHSAKEALAWLEKQGEKEPIDKVEPKFRVGDWVACNSDDLRYLLRIVSISDKEYRTEDIQGVSARPKIWYLDKHYHRWTINDAKCGDVLAGEYDDCKKPWVGIFKCISENRPQTQFDSYCFITCYRHEFITPDSCDFCNRCKGHTIRYTKPATKKQRDFLFQKMYEAGYEWDAERKELRGLSQSEETSDQEQKPTWSAEDERMLNSTIWHLRYSVNNGDMEYSAGQLEDWLESIKDRIK